jgi:iron(II)-dependent oxidoreductase
MKSSDLAAMLTDARRCTLALVADLTDEQIKVPRLEIINPPVWEMGHVAWFQEKWALRHLRGVDSIRSDADGFWDSSAIAHDARWELPLPPRQETMCYMQQVLDRVLEGLDRPDDITGPEAYFHWLPLMHEDMHAEALWYTRQTLGYPAPVVKTEPAAAAADISEEDAFIPGGSYLLGAQRGEAFVFDNEKWAHAHDLRPFAISRTAVTNRQFAAFVEDRGYHREELWSGEGWQWRHRAGASIPIYWMADGSRWLIRSFDQNVPLAADLPVMHVNWYEAEAYCRWAHRRLPTEAEWELAATGFGRKSRFPWGDEAPVPTNANLDGRTPGCLPVGAAAAGDSVFGCRQMIGNVWEWTATDFRPYPGFTVDPYKEYSEPWFGSDRKVLRGGCWATRSRLIRNTWRNYFTKERRDIFAGFRTCAV